MSKGSKRRPTQVDDDRFKDNWDKVFKARVQQVVQDEKVEEAESRTPSEAPELSMPTPSREARAS